MNLRFTTSLAEGYKSASQIARVLTENWLAHNMSLKAIKEKVIDFNHLLLMVFIESAFEHLFL